MAVRLIKEAEISYRIVDPLNRIHGGTVRASGIQFLGHLQSEARESTFRCKLPWTTRTRLI